MNEHLLYDVAIIGGGLAGLCLAIQCAEKQYKVILFEKEEYPFHKVCGEYISLESWDFLKRLGVNLHTIDLPIIKNLKISDAGGKEYSFNLPLGGFGISRFSLDNTLYQIAIAKGVEVHANCKVNNVEYNQEHFLITDTGKTITAKVAAGAFGKRSNIDIKWNRSFTRQKPNSLNNFIGIKYHIKFPHDRNQIYLHNFQNGYCGMSAIEDGKSCLCYLTTAHNLRMSGNVIKEMEKTILFKNPRLKEILSSADILYDQPLAISQISFERKSRVENHVLMLGDAAGMISPLCGNGMSMAMLSSKIAFDKIQAFLSNNITRTTLENGYTESWEKEFSQRLWLGRNVQRLFGGKFSTSIFLKALHLVPSLARKVIQSTHGQPF